MLEHEGGLDELVWRKRDPDRDEDGRSGGAKVLDERFDDSVGVARGAAGAVTDKTKSGEVRKATKKRRAGGEVGAEAIDGLIGVLAVLDLERVGPD